MKIFTITTGFLAPPGLGNASTCIHVGLRERVRKPEGPSAPQACGPEGHLARPCPVARKAAGGTAGLGPGYQGRFFIWVVSRAVQTRPMGSGLM